MSVECRFLDACRRQFDACQIGAPSRTLNVSGRTCLLLALLATDWPRLLRVDVWEVVELAGRRTSQSFQQPVAVSAGSVELANFITGLAVDANGLLKQRSLQRERTAAARFLEVFGFAFEVSVFSVLDGIAVGGGALPGSNTSPLRITSPR